MSARIVPKQSALPLRQVFARSIRFNMRRSNRLFRIMQILRNGERIRAQDIAEQVQVSVRTVYRDMETLVASGVPVEGSRGVGYRITDAITVPPLTLTVAELEALNLGAAIVGESADPELKAAAQSLAAKLDAVLSTQTVAEADAWKFATSPFANAARGFAYMPTLRAAIRARQKLRLSYFSDDGTAPSGVIRPLQLEYWGRVWTLTAWCEQHDIHRVFRVDLIRTAEALPELFVDEPGKALSDFAAGRTD